MFAPCSEGAVRCDHCGFRFTEEQAAGQSSSEERGTGRLCSLVHLSRGKWDRAEVQPCRYRSEPETDSAASGGRRLNLGCHLQITEYEIREKP